MQDVMTISSPPFEISLSVSEAGLTATLKGHQTYYFTKEQITCGVLGNLSHQALIAKIHPFHRNKSDCRFCSTSRPSKRALDL